MANVLTVVWFVIALVVTQTSLMVWTALMLPDAVGRARQRIETAAGRTMAAGAAFWILSLLVAVALLRNGRAAPVQLAGWACVAPMLAASVVGGAAFARVLADRMRSAAPGASPLALLVGAAFCLSLCTVVPVIGQVVFLPLVGWTSVGAGLALFRRAPRTAPVSSVAPSAAPESLQLQDAQGA